MSNIGIKEASVVEDMFTMHKALGVIPSTTMKSLSHTHVLAQTCRHLYIFSFLPSIYDRRKNDWKLHMVCDSS